MRRAFIVAGPLGIALFAFACEDDPQSNPTAGFPEAGTVDTNRPPSPDGSTPVVDAAPDVDSALPPQPVTVVVGNRKGPRQGVVVVFHDANGAVLETKTTDATGRATSNAAGPIPAMATALMGKDQNRRDLLTWTGLEAGDELIAAEPEPEVSLGFFDVSVPGPIDAGGVSASSYSVDLGHCSGFNEGSPISMEVHSSCSGALNAPRVRANDGDSNVLGYAFKKNVPPPTDGGTVTVDNLTGWVPVSNFTVNVQNPPGVSPVSAHLLEIASGLATPNTTAFFVTAVNPAVFKVAAGYADAYQASVRYVVNDQALEKRRRLATRLVGTATSATFDFQQALPELTAVSVDSTDKKRPALSWTAASTLAGTDGGFVRTAFFNGDDRVRWTIVIAPGGTTGTVKAPILPQVDAAQFLPPDDDSGQGPTWSDAEALFAEADSLADYKAFRKFQGIVNQADGTPAGFLPANGSFKTTEIVPGQSF